MFTRIQTKKCSTKYFGGFIVGQNSFIGLYLQTGHFNRQNMCVSTQFECSNVRSAKDTSVAMCFF